METLVYIALALLAMTLAGAIAMAPACSSGYRPLLSGYTLILYTMVLYILLSAAVPIFFNDMKSFFYESYSGPAEFFYALIVNWLGVVFFVFSYHFFARNRPARYSVPPARKAENGFFPFVGYVCVVAGLAMKFLFIIRAGGLHTLLLTRSTGIAGNLGLTDQFDSFTQYLAFFSVTADAAACWLFLQSLMLRKQMLVHTLILFGVLVMTFLITPKRGVLILPLLSLLVGFTVYVRPVRIGHAPMFLLTAVLFSMLTLAGRIFLPAYLANVNVLDFAQLDLVRKFAIKLLSADIAFFDATAVVVSYRDFVLAQFGGLWDAIYRPNIQVLFYAVPRFIWPDKPFVFVDVAMALRAIERGLPLDVTQGGNGVGMIGVFWLYGYVPGLAIGMGLLGWFACFVDRFLARMHDATPSRILTFAVSMTMLFSLYRQGTIGWTFLNFFQTTLVFWLTVLFLLYAGRSRRTALPAVASAGAAI